MTGRVTMAGTGDELVARHGILADVRQRRVAKVVTMQPGNPSGELFAANHLSTARKTLCQAV